MDNANELKEALDFLSPSALTYDEWILVGMGLKEAGLPVEAWEQWSARDGGRYHKGECAKKWASFHGGGGSPVTASSIFQLAYSSGWRGPAGHALDWNDDISAGTNHTDGQLVDPRWVEAHDLALPEQWDPVDQLRRYLQALFEEDEYVAYVTESFMADDKRRPAKGSDPVRTQLPLFLLLSLFIGVGVIAWSITVREDLHSPSPRQHMRYLEPLFMPLLLVTLNTLDEQLSAARRRVLAALTAVWGVGFIAFCRAIGAGAGDNTLLQWFDFVADRLDRLPVLGLNGWLLVWRCIIVVGAAVIGALLLRRKARRAMAGAVLALCVLCYAGEWRINRWTYGIDAETMQAASDLNDSLHELDGTVLFIPYGIRQRDSQLIETYVDRDFYIAEYETLVQTGLLDDGVLDLTTEAPAPEYPGHAYTDLAEADWLLVSDDVPLDTTNLTLSGIACPAGYTLWQNHAPTQVQF